MNPKPNKYRIDEKHDTSIAACSIYVALIHDGRIFIMPDRLTGEDDNINPYWNNAPRRQWQAIRPHPEFTILASYPDSRLAIAIYGPLHKQTHHKKFVLIHEDRAWYIKHKRREGNAYLEAKFEKEIRIIKLRANLVAESKQIVDEWLSEQFH